MQKTVSMNHLQLWRLPDWYARCRISAAVFTIDRVFAQAWVLLEGWQNYK
jgi:hypothetical protein